MDTFRAKHFSLSLPGGADQDNISALLRHLATTIEGIGEVTILDIVFHNEVEGDKYWPSFTVYFEE